MLQNVNASPDSTRCIRAAADQEPSPSWNVGSKIIASPGLPDHGLPCLLWSLAKLADFMVAEVQSTTLSREGFHLAPRGGVSFQHMKLEALRRPGLRGQEGGPSFSIADDEVIPEEGEPETPSAWAPSGRSTYSPIPRRHWAKGSARRENPDREPRARRLATSTRPRSLHRPNERVAIVWECETGGVPRGP